LATPSGIAAWEQCTSALLVTHPDSPVALYLRADALAREKRWEDAIVLYSQAIEARPGFALALNGLGVAYAYRGDVGKSLAALNDACRAAPGFAEAHASLGTLLLSRRAPEGALESFDRALRISPEFALARNGRACARFGARADSAGAAAASTDLAAVMKCELLRPLAMDNVHRIVAGLSPEAEAESLRTPEGTYISTRQLFDRSPIQQNQFVSNMSPAQKMAALDQVQQHMNWSNRVAGALGWLDGQIGGSGRFFSGVIENSRADAAKWSNLSDKLAGGLRHDGFDPTAGGATTEDLARECRGNWTLLTWFGLMPQSELPSWAK
jgi:tetratricopeptide (TPR) repeat protein